MKINFIKSHDQQCCSSNIKEHFLLSINISIKLTIPLELRKIKTKRGIEIN